ncbi:aldehyde dehydrogenase family protein, partial [Acinetobacter baumannii]
AHIEAMRTTGHAIHQSPLPPDTRAGTFVAPTIIEIGALSELKREVFGPVLHVLRFRRDQLDEVIAGVNATGYGLTFGIHSRIDETINA